MAKIELNNVEFSATAIENSVADFCMDLPVETVVQFTGAVFGKINQLLPNGYTILRHSDELLVDLDAAGFQSSGKLLGKEELIDGIDFDEIISSAITEVDNNWNW